MTGFIVEYFKKTESYTAGRFIFEMFLLETIVLFLLIMIISIASFMGIDLVGNHDFNENYIIDNYHWFFSLLILCCIVPLFETSFSQFIPIVVISRWTKNRVVPILCSALLFTLLHSYPVIVLFYIFFSGVIYAWSFIVFYQKGCVAGVLITSIIHGLDNFLAFILFMMY